MDQDTQERMHRRSCRDHLRSLAVAALLVATPSCSMGRLNPFTWGSSSTPEDTGGGGIGDTVEQISNSAYKWVWLLLFVGLAFKDVRKPVVELLESLFLIPTEAFRAVHRKLTGNGKKKESE